MSNRPKPKKPRSDSKLAKLTPEQQALLRSWLIDENVGYIPAVKRVAQEFGVSTNVDALSRFYHSDALPWKYARSRDKADSLGQLMEGNYDAPTIAAAKELAFDALTSPTPNVDFAAKLLKIVGASAKLELQQRSLSLELEKFRESVKTGVEKGLDALFAEIKDNPEAVALFTRFKAVVAQGVAETKA